MSEPAQPTLSCQCSGSGRIDNERPSSNVHRKTLVEMHLHTNRRDMIKTLAPLPLMRLSRDTIRGMGRNRTIQAGDRVGTPAGTGTRGLAELVTHGSGCLIFRKATRIEQRRGRRIMVIPKLPKLEPWVRFPSPAPLSGNARPRRATRLGSRH